ncbi:hypothetical protein F2Q69_00056654 [Brassica cretica]|uniref:5'-3' exonuclease alpha-helical arch N-terminal domain-containing protein n=1 Tax=Brassica cretica TaxID=69181 RepID=A0A8S9MTY8_BRACR|nr:hypothetical protein F2Q69_00056654 [Brassica cretica]
MLLDLMTSHLSHHSRLLWRNLCFLRRIENLCNMRNYSLIISPSLARTTKLITSAASSNGGRVMLIDGTSIMYRAYYKLLARLNHGHLTHADGNADWVFTIFSALSLVVFDHDGVAYGSTSNSSNGYRSSKGAVFSSNAQPAAVFSCYGFVHTERDVYSLLSLLLSDENALHELPPYFLPCIGDYAEGFPADPVIRETLKLWESLEAKS